MDFISTVFASSETMEYAPQGGVLGSLGLDFTLFVFQFINLAIVGAVVWFLILKPVTKKMVERGKIIDKSLVDAKKARENLEHAQRDYAKRLEEAEVEYKKVVGKSILEAKHKGDLLEEKAKERIRQLVEQTKKSLLAEREELREELRGETVNLLILALEKFLKEKITGVEDKKNIEKILESVKQKYEK